MCNRALTESNIKVNPIIFPVYNTWDPLVVPIVTKIPPEPLSRQSAVNPTQRVPSVFTCVDKQSSPGREFLERCLAT